MATLSKGQTFAPGDTVTATKLNNLVDLATISGIVNADVSNSAGIAHNKLANVTAGSILLGNASNVPTATAITGDVTVTSSGVTAIASGAIVDADVNASAAIAHSKMASSGTATAGQFVPTTNSVPTNGMYLPGTNTVGFSTNSTARMTIGSGGQVGVVTTSPQSYYANADDFVVGNHDAGVSRGMTIASGNTASGFLAFARGTSANQAYAGYLQYDHNGNVLHLAVQDGQRVTVKGTGQLRLVPMASDPGSAEAGDIYYNSTANTLKFYNGTAWKTVTSS